MMSHLLVNDCSDKSTAQVVALGGGQQCLVSDTCQDFPVFRSNSIGSEYRPVSSVVANIHIHQYSRNNTQMLTLIQSQTF